MLPNPHLGYLHFKASARLGVGGGGCFSEEARGRHRPGRLTRSPMFCHPARAHFPPFNYAVTGKNQPLIRQCYLIKMAPRLARALITSDLESGGGRGEAEGKEGRDRSPSREKDGEVGCAPGRGGGQDRCRADQRLEGRAAGGGYHETKKGGGADVAFDFTDILNGIRPHHVRVFVCLPPAIVRRARPAPSPVCLLVWG